MAITAKAQSIFAPPGEWLNLFTNSGERYLPLVNSYNAAMHLGHMASYREALRYSYGRRVLDIGCGVGYGAFFLASYGARFVAGVDVSAEALAYAKQVYAHPRIEYLEASAFCLPFADSAFDFVFSSQVIEHLADPKDFLREVRRILTPTGLCLITTPNKRLFSPEGNSNYHHLSEMDLTTYQEMAQAIFPYTYFQGIPQHCLALPEGHSAPVAKSNAEIRLEDYRVQSHNLEICENLLCYGYLQPDQPAVTLPGILESVANELTPLFWDSSVSSWVGMEPHFEREPVSSISLWGGQRLTQIFKTTHPNLYRVEVELITPTSVPLQVRLYRQSDNKLVAEEILRPAAKNLTLCFEPQTDSRNQGYTLSIQLPFTLAGLWPWGKPLIIRAAANQLLSTQCQIGHNLQKLQLVMYTFHNYLTKPLIV